MAISRSNFNDSVVYVFGLFSLLLLIQRGGAYEFKVGGSGDWSVPSEAQSYNQWAEKKRFQIGDTLLFEYPADKDSVLQVSNDHYTNCTTDKPLASFTNGHTVFKFNTSGPFFFISGSKSNCQKNEKLHVIVLADRNATISSPPPSPAESAPSPTPSESTPAPTSDEGQTQVPPKNGASSFVVSGVGLIGAFVGSSIVLGL